MNIQVNISEVISLLTTCSWNWESCGGRVDNATMDSYISIIESNISESKVESAFLYEEKDLILHFEKEGIDPTSKDIAMYIAKTAAEFTLEAAGETLLYDNITFLPYIK